MKIHATIFEVLMSAIMLGLTGCPPKPELEVKLSSPADAAEVRLLAADWKALVQSRVTAPGDEHPDNLAFPLPVNLRWQVLQPGKSIVEIARDQEFTDIVKTVDAGFSENAGVFNLETGRTYYWRVKFTDEKNHNALSKVRSFRTLDDTPRLIFIPGDQPVPFNIRDTGGKHRIGGGRTKQGMVYRGTEFDLGYKLTEAGRKVLRDELKIRTDLDLRYPNHVANRTQSELGPDIRWIHIPVNAYDSFTPEQNGYFRDAIRTFAKPENYPVYFHCSGGADRTGEIAFLLEGLLDVEVEEMFLDYELTSLSIFPRSRDIAYFVQWRKKIESFGNPADSWRMKIEKYMLAIGVTPAEIAAIRQNLIEE